MKFFDRTFLLKVIGNRDIEHMTKKIVRSITNPEVMLKDFAIDLMRIGCLLTFILHRT